MRFRFRLIPTLFSVMLVLAYVGCRDSDSNQVNSNGLPSLQNGTEVVKSPPSSTTASSSIPTNSSERETKDVGLAKDWQSFEKTDLIDEALRVMDLLVERFPDSADSYEARARVQLLIGQTEEARRSWSKCLQIVPNYGYAFHGLGLIETKLSHYEEAISYYQKALETIPNYKDSVRELSDAYLKSGQIPLAAQVLENYLSANPNDSELWLRLGQTYNAGLEFSKAKSAFEESLRLTDDNPKAEQGLLIALVRLGDREQAKVLAEKTKARPSRENDSIEELLKNERTDIANRYWFAALVYRSFKSFDQSAALLERAHLYNPANTQVLESLVEQEVRSQAWQTAYHYAAKLTELDQSNPSYFFGAAALAEKLQRISDAKDMYRTVIRLAPSDPKAYRQLVTILLTTNTNLEEAESVATAWVSIDGTASPLAYLATAQAMQNNLRGAEITLEKALALDPESRELKKRANEIKTLLNAKAKTPN